MSRVIHLSTLAIVCSVCAFRSTPALGDDGVVKGKIVIFPVFNPNEPGTCLVKTMSRDGSINMLAGAELNITSGRISPDAKFLAYVTNHDGKRDIRLLSFGDG